MTNTNTTELRSRWVDCYRQNGMRTQCVEEKWENMPRSETTSGKKKVYPTIPIHGATNVSADKRRRSAGK